ncbi:hypothetical protein GGR43_004664 [Sphingobium jiangsuense]|uniref:DUF7666 domain-containing protein n=1 Tax=Sphingobium jiangsuense TaxID=870476 RepID=A0A7W6FTA9_9SPHN|nr:hypothetical protein [Sphingobium jiangsuense]MBB3928919.1 hypothetical protein [Sphingobium jiangsuense]
MSEETAIVSIKGMNADMTCRGYQFALGQTYAAEGEAKCCKNGFHACPTDLHPLTVFSFYPPAGSRFFEVGQAGSICRAESDKAASTILTVNVEIGVGDLVKRAWEWVWERAIKSDENHATGDYGAASATGYQGAASATGDYGAASATGYRGAASATGNYGAASATGYRGAASATGDYGAASATGDRGAASATGDYGAASATGDRGAASATGNYGAAKAANGSAAMTNGYAGRIMGETEGCPLFCVERDENYDLLSVACGVTGRDGIDVGVWYVCRDGKLVPADV